MKGENPVVPVDSPLNAANATYDVHMGPRSFIGKEVSITAGDQLEVLGQR